MMASTCGQMARIGAHPSKPTWRRSAAAAQGRVAEAAFGHSTLSPLISALVVGRSATCWRCSSKARAVAAAGTAWLVPWSKCSGRQVGRSQCSDRNTGPA